MCVCYHKLTVLPGYVTSEFWLICIPVRIRCQKIHYTCIPVSLISMVECARLGRLYHTKLLCGGCQVSQTPAMVGRLFQKNVLCASPESTRLFQNRPSQKTNWIMRLDLQYIWLDFPSQFFSLSRFLRHTQPIFWIDKFWNKWLDLLMRLVLSRLMCGPYSNNLQTLYHYWVETRDPRTIEERKKMKRWGRSQALKEQIDESDNQTSKLTDLSLYIYI